MIYVPLAVFVLFFVVPSTIGYLYAFTDWSQSVQKVSFVGLSNFKEVLQNKTLNIAFANTMIFAIVKTVVVTVLGMAFAIVLNQKLKTVNVLRTVYFLPAVFSTLIVGLIFAALFDSHNGVIDRVLDLIGLTSLSKEWLGRRGPALFTITLAEIWRSLGYAIVITLAALQSIPSDYIEAAEVDGATGWQKFSHVMLPLIMPSVNINILFSLMYGLKMFDLVYILTGGGPGHDTETFGTLILNEMSSGRYSHSVAINLIFTILLVIISVLYQKYANKTEENL